MVIQSKDLPFVFTLVEYKSNYESFISSTNDIRHEVKFHDDIKDLNSAVYKPDISFKELRKISVRIDCDYPVRLEMSGFDSYNRKPFKTDSRGTYIDTVNEEVFVFSYDDFPLPPGNFEILIEVNGKSYYTGFNITALNVSQTMWDIMANEVKQSIRFMALQFAKTHITLGNLLKNEMLLGELFLKMKVIDSNFNQVVAALDDLCVNAHSKISKSYIKVPAVSNYREDAKTYKLNNRIKDNDKEYAVLKYTDYQLNENIFIKQKVLELKKLIVLFLDEIDARLDSLSFNINNDSYGKKHNSTEYVRKVHALHQMKKYAEEASKIKNTINRLEDTDWFKQINLYLLTRISSQSMFDPRYGIISKLSRELKKNSFHFDMDASLTFIEQRSDHLYELWGILKIIEILQTLGFELQAGLHVTEDEYGFYVHALDSGYCFELRKNNILIRVSYEKALPRNISEIDINENPIYTTSDHNLPDCRIDLYNSRKEADIEYYGSLIIDFKYRKKYNFWYDKSKTKRQIFAYKRNPRTKWYGVEGSMPQAVINKSVLPVMEAWVLYPDMDTPKNEEDAMDKNIKLYSFIPGYEECLYDHFNEFFEAYLEDKYQKALPQNRTDVI